MPYMPYMRTPLRPPWHKLKLGHYRPGGMPARRGGGVRQRRPDLRGDQREVTGQQTYDL